MNSNKVDNYNDFEKKLLAELIELQELDLKELSIKELSLQELVSQESKQQRYDVINKTTDIYFMLTRDNEKKKIKKLTEEVNDLKDNLLYIDDEIVACKNDIKDRNFVQSHIIKRRFFDKVKLSDAEIEAELEQDIENLKLEKANGETVRQTKKEEIAKYQNLMNEKIVHLDDILEFYATHNALMPDIFQTIISESKTKKISDPVKLVKIYLEGLYYQEDSLKRIINESFNRMPRENVKILAKIIECAKTSEIIKAKKNQAEILMSLNKIKDEIQSKIIELSKLKERGLRFFVNEKTEDQKDENGNLNIRIGHEVGDRIELWSNASSSDRSRDSYKQYEHRARNLTILTQDYIESNSSEFDYMAGGTNITIYKNSEGFEKLSEDIKNKESKETKEINVGDDKNVKYIKYIDITTEIAQVLDEMMNRNTDIEIKNSEVINGKEIGK